MLENFFFGVFLLVCIGDYKLNELCVKKKSEKVVKTMKGCCGSDIHIEYRFFFAQARCPKYKWFGLKKSEEFIRLLFCLPCKEHKKKIMEVGRKT
jgi:hypothetical protein